MEQTRYEQIAVANEIIRQLGGNKFRVMTGAKDIFALENGVSFKLPGGGGFIKHGINYIKVWLDPSDTYTIEFWKYRKLHGQKIAEYRDIYNDQLQDVFTEETGLQTHL